jgi:hypothetical protein
MEISYAFSSFFPFFPRLCFKTKVGRKKLSSIRERVNEIFIRAARSLLVGSKYVVIVVVVVVVAAAVVVVAVVVIRHT